MKRQSASPRQAEVVADYCGFEIADAYVVGYGLDHNDRYRHLPYIAVVEKGDKGVSDAQGS